MVVTGLEFGLVFDVIPFFDNLAITQYWGKANDLSPYHSLWYECLKNGIKQARTLPSQKQVNQGFDERFNLHQ